METLGEVHDRIDPISKPSYTLGAVQHYTVTEYQFVFLGIRSARSGEHHLQSRSPLTSQKNFTVPLWRSLPVRQSQYEELNECSLQEELLVLATEGAEPRNSLSPFLDNLHGSSEEIIKLLDVIGVHLLRQVLHIFLVLNIEKKKVV